METHWWFWCRLLGTLKKYATTTCILFGRDERRCRSWLNMCILVCKMVLRSSRLVSSVSILFFIGSHHVEGVLGKENPIHQRGCWSNSERYGPHGVQPAGLSDVGIYLQIDGSVYLTCSVDTESHPSMGRRLDHQQ